jgi:polyhydroxyalkanoate synthesis regulator phasin
MMKKLLLAATAIAALGAATPASAQLGGVIEREILQQGLRGILGGGGSSARLERLDDRIDQAARRGEISGDEARRLYDEFEQLRRLDRDLRRGGLNRDERYELERRIDRLERRIEDARLDRGGRYDDYDRDGRYGRYGDYNRDRDDRYRGDRYERDRADRDGCPPGLAKKRNGCLPPGQARKNGGYDSRDRFPGEYRDRYRDSDRFVYRRQADGTVLQIDRRTGEVVRVIGRR